MSEIFIRKQLQFTANLREPERYPMPSDVDAQGMALYQEQYFNKIAHILGQAFPVLKSTQSCENWSALVRDFIAKHKSKRPTQYEIPEEFLHYLSYVRVCPEDPAWIFELAHYEWLELSLELSPLSLAQVTHQYAGNLLDEIPVVSPLAWLATYQYPVHTIKSTTLPCAPSEEPIYLVAFRNWQDQVECLHINDFIHALLSFLIQPGSNLTGREVLECLVQLTSHPDPDLLIQGGGLIMEELRERHIILGTRIL